MAVKQSDAALGKFPLPYPSFAGEVVAHRFAYTVLAGLALNDIIELAPIPVGCRVVDMILDSDDIDSNGSPTVLYDVGVMSGVWGDPDNARTVGAEFFSGSNIGQAGGTARPTLKTAFRVVSSTTERSIGVKIATGAATLAAGGEIGLTVLYRAS